jgi:hypothetical protein
MALAYSLFKMERFILVIFTRAKHTGKGEDFFRMETATLGSGATEQALARAASTTRMVVGTKARC